MDRNGRGLETLHWPMRGSLKWAGHWVCSPPPSRFRTQLSLPFAILGSLNCLSSFSGSLPSLASPLMYRFLKATSSSLITLQAGLPCPSSLGFFPCIGSMGIKQCGGVSSSGLLSTPPPHWSRAEMFVSEVPLASFLLLNPWGGI